MDLLTPTIECPTGYWWGYNQFTGRYASGPAWCQLNACPKCFPRMFAEKCHDLYGLDELVIVRGKYEQKDLNRLRMRAKKLNSGGIAVPLRNDTRIILTVPAVEFGPTDIPAIIVTRAIATVLHTGIHSTKRISFFGWKPYKRPRQYVTDIGRAKTRRIQNEVVEDLQLTTVDPATIDDTMAAIRKEVERRGRRINRLNSKEPIRDLLAPEQ